MFSGSEFREITQELGVTHVVWLPDSTFGTWESALREAESPRLITVCREGEAWAIAAGLYLGGASPLVVIQCTGLFESGDALRNTLKDYGLPLWSIVGYRSYLNDSTLPGDTAREFAEPILQAWQLPYLLVEQPSQRNDIVRHFTQCRSEDQPGVVLLAEGRA